MPVNFSYVDIVAETEGKPQTFSVQYSMAVQAAQVKRKLKHLPVQFPFATKAVISKPLLLKIFSDSMTMACLI